MRKSSTADEDAIWFGCSDVIPEMHLGREQVKTLLPILHRFVETGEIAKDEIVCDNDSNLDSAENTAIRIGGKTIGVVKRYHKTGVVECVLWDEFLDTSFRRDEKEKLSASGFDIRCPGCNERHRKETWEKIFKEKQHKV